MTPQELDELVAVAEAQRQRGEADLARVAKQEAQLRALLAEMAAQFAEGVARVGVDMLPMHGLGAHQAWVDFTRRRRAKINQDLALVIAQRLQCTDALRRLVGRQEALTMLRHEAATAQKRKREIQAEDQLIQAHILRAASSMQRDDVVAFPNP